MKYRRMLKVAILSLCAGYLGLAVIVFLLQRRLIYPYRGEGTVPRAAGSELLKIPGPGTTTTVALHRPAPPGAPTVVYFHGNAEELADQDWIVESLGDRGLGVLAVEYPGYGLAAESRLDEEAIYATADTAVAYLRDRLGVGTAEVVLAGRSLGTGVAVDLAARGLGARVVLISPYTSIADMATHVLPLFPARWLVRDRFDNAAKAPAIDVPVLILHGTDDGVIPAAMGRKLGALFPNAIVDIVEGRDHQTVLFGGHIAPLERVAAFARGKPGKP